MGIKTRYLKMTINDLYLSKLCRNKLHSTFLAVTKFFNHVLPISLTKNFNMTPHICRITVWPVQVDIDTPQGIVSVGLFRGPRIVYSSTSNPESYGAVIMKLVAHNVVVVRGIQGTPQCQLLSSYNFIVVLP